MTGTETWLFCTCTYTPTHITHVFNTDTHIFEYYVDRLGFVYAVFRNMFAAFSGSHKSILWYKRVEVNKILYYIFKIIVLKFVELDPDGIYSISRVFCWEWEWYTK